MGVRAAATLCALALALALQPARAARAPAARQHFPGAARGGGAVVLVSGATGRTGSLAYAALAARAGAAPLSTRALVRNATKAREVLGCGACTAAEGVFVGDVTGELPQEAFDGVDALIVATSSAPRQLPNGTWSYPKGGSPEDVDFRGTLNQVAAAARSQVDRIVLISSMGTTQPDSFLDLLGGGHVLMYKLAAEAHLMAAAAASSLSYTIIKPSGLTDGAPGTSELVVGHEDDFGAHKCGEPGPQGCISVARGDVAAMAAAAAADPAYTAAAGDVRFDLTSDATGPAPKGFADIFREARHYDSSGAAS